MRKPFTHLIFKLLSNAVGLLTKSFNLLFSFLFYLDSEHIVSPPSPAQSKLLDVAELQNVWNKCIGTVHDETWCDKWYPLRFNDVRVWTNNPSVKDEEVHLISCTRRLFFGNKLNVKEWESSHQNNTFQSCSIILYHIFPNIVDNSHIVFTKQEPELMCLLVPSALSIEGIGFA